MQYYDLSKHELKFQGKGVSCFFPENLKIIFFMKKLEANEPLCSQGSIKAGHFKRINLLVVSIFLSH